MILQIGDFVKMVRQGWARTIDNQKLYAYC